MKKFLCFILTLLLCSAAVSCSSADTEESLTPEIAVRSCPLSDGCEDIKTHGRTTLTSEGLICDASASGIEFNAYIEGSLSITVNVTAECYFTLYTDGERCEERFKATEGTQVLTVADFAEGGVHNIRFLKQTEAQCALCTIEKIEFTGYFEEKPADRELYIEFIGDSITVGYGSLCPNGTAEHGAAVNQDSTQAYSFLAAELLGADATLVCYSGIGLAHGWCDFTMDSFYKADSYVRDTEAVFTPARIPDIIVINLGTNDWSMNSTYEELQAKVTELIEQVRTLYGEAVPVIWVHGMMGDGKWADISAILENDCNGEAGGIYSLEITENREGGATHPIIEAHYSAAQTLADFIKAKGLDK